MLNIFRTDSDSIPTDTKRLAEYFEQVCRVLIFNTINLSEVFFKIKSINDHKGTMIITIKEPLSKNVIEIFRSIWNISFNEDQFLIHQEYYIWELMEKKFS